MTKTRNVLEKSIKPFTEPSLEEIVEDKRIGDKFFNSIPDYPEGSKPTEEEIKTVEKVLKYASQCQYMSFTKEDALLVFGVSTNILKWNFGYLPK